MKRKKKPPKSINVHLALFIEATSIHKIQDVSRLFRFTFFHKDLRPSHIYDYPPADSVLCGVFSMVYIQSFRYLLMDFRLVLM